jgi:hypothetical protein
MVGSDGQAIGFDGWSAGSWPEVGAKPLPESIVRARRFRDELAAAPMPEGVRVTILAGDCVPTTRAALYRKDGSFAFYPGELRPDERHLTRVLFEPGDGTVPWTSAAGDGVQFFCDGHQGIAADPNVHRAILRALERSR